MIGASFMFDDRPAVWREVPAIPRAGEVIVYDGDRYCVEEVTWYGTDTTWAVTIRCRRQ